MIVTVTLNPCVDKTVFVKSLVPGGMNIIEGSQIEYAGKGINVAKGVAALGKDVVASGFMYDGDHARCSAALAGEGVRLDCVVCPGQLRVNTKVFDMDKREVTELNERGSATSERCVREVMEKVEALSRQCKIMVISGSLPPDCPVDVYARMIAKCRDHCIVILDATGPQLELAIKERPKLIKPNKSELEVLCGRKLETAGEILREAKQIVATGVECVCVSMGSEGALVTNGTESYFAPPIRGLTVRGTVCAGDSMVAGFAIGFLDNLNLRDSFARAVASAGACVSRDGSGVVTKELMEELLPQVEIQNLQNPQ